MAFFNKKREIKTEIKPKEMAAFIDSKINSEPKSGGFSLAKIEPDYSSLERLDDAHYKAMLSELKERISGLLTEGGCFCFLPEGGIIMFFDEKYSGGELAETGWRIITECCREMDFNGITACPEINAGLAMYPESGRTYDALSASLNIALTVSKKEGVNTFSVYTSNLTDEKSKEYRQLAELKDGVNKNQFQLFYQPIMDLTAPVAYGAEALLRWRHPILGIVSPKDFFDVIEASGEIYQLGLWTFAQMLEKWHEWRITSVGKMIFSVNLSAKQLIHASLLDDIRRIVKKFSSLNASEICFEISGFAASLNDETIMNNIAGLSRMGFLIAIDNFNFGDPGLPLNALLRLPVNIVKLDGAHFDTRFDAVRHDALSRLVQVGAAHGIKFIAEGIESKQMLEHAAACGIALAQGFYFARPSEFEQLAPSIAAIAKNY